MRQGTIHSSAAPDRPSRMPELPRCYSGETVPIQRLFALAYLRVQQARQEAEDERQKDADCQSAVIVTQQHTAEAHLSLEQCLELIVDQARRITAVDGAAIALRDGKDFICRGRSGPLAPDLGARVDLQSGISGACLREGEVQQCDDTETDSRVDPSVCRSQGIRSILAVPVRRDGVFGILAVFSGWAGVFSERDVRALSLLAESVGTRLLQAAPVDAGVAETPPGQLAPDTAETPHALESTDRCDVELPPAALEVRESPARRERWALKTAVLALAALVVTSEVVVWRGLHVKEVFSMAKALFAAPTSGAMPRSTSHAIPKPAATIPRPQTTLKTVPKTTPSSTATPDWTRSSRNAHGDKVPTASTRQLPDQGAQAAAVPNPTSGRIEGPLNLHSLFAGLEKVVQPEPVNSEAHTTLPSGETGDKIHGNDQPQLKRKAHRSQAESEHILAFRGELRDRMHMSRTQGVVAIRFAIYAQSQGGAPLWQEVQNVEVDQFGDFSAQVGSTSAGGFPEFARGLWLGWLVQQPGEVERRMWLVDTPSGFRGEGAVGQIADRD